MSLKGTLKIDDIAGESKSAEHEDEIDVYGVHWKVEQRSSSMKGSGRTQSRADISCVKFYKEVDASSPYLALASMRGQHIPEIVFNARKDSGDAHLDYLKITMTDCIVSFYEMENTGDDEVQVIRESICISCESINMLYTLQADDHSAGAEHEMEFNIVQGK